MIKGMKDKEKALKNNNTRCKDEVDENYECGYEKHKNMVKKVALRRCFSVKPTIKNRKI